MALPMLINGTDCGPINPLQGLAKRLDQDRGIQQDHFGAGRAGSSRETFRTQQTPPSGFGQDASHFFSSTAGLSGFSSLAPSPFDLTALRSSLPSSHASSPPVHSPPPLQQQRVVTSWATDFLEQHKPRHSPVAQVAGAKLELRQDQSTSALSPVPLNKAAFNGGPQWVSQMEPMRHGAQWIPVAAPQAHNPAVNSAALLWDKEFQSQEASISSQTTIQSRSQPSQYEGLKYASADASDLARTAGLLVETVRDEQNPKFKNSQFMSLMRQLRDGVVIVEGNDMVERSSVAPGLLNQDASSSDVKGKGKERVAETIIGRNSLQQQTLNSLQSSGVPLITTDIPRHRRKSVHFDHDEEQLVEETGHSREEDPNEDYFRQDNEDYIDYWNTQAPIQPPPQQGQTSEWGALQDDWDSFEATASGIKSIANYAFQPHNPYLLGYTARTNNHMMHLEGPQSFYESVLELEAAVQRDPTNVQAWFELGVKQQENEREPKAILALQRALDLDTTHLPAWLAVAISHTNENNRVAADDAIEQWVGRNVRYQEVVKEYRASVQRSIAQPPTQSQKHAELIECLMAIARSSNDEIDADVQIALAVLLNTSEDYEKAQDCFRTALAVRPDDWQLYNRVGATLANSGNAEEAFQYYYRALELNPAYIRARFNLGISCINMKKYEEAAQHILDALVLQDSDGAVNGTDDKRGITSSALWESLKTTCLHLQRIDLASLCDRQDLDGLRHEFHV